MSLYGLTVATLATCPELFSVLTGKAGTKCGFLCILASLREEKVLGFDLKKNPCIAQRRRGAEKNKTMNWAHCRAQYTPKADFAKVAFDQNV